MLLVIIIIIIAVQKLQYFGNRFAVISLAVFGDRLYVSV